MLGITVTFLAQYDCERQPIGRKNMWSRAIETDSTGHYSFVYPVDGCAEYFGCGYPWKEIVYMVDFTPFLNDEVSSDCLKNWQVHVPDTLWVGLPLQ